MNDINKGRCPDGGYCHHLCETADACWRVQHCGPLSGAFLGDRWPQRLIEAARKPTALEELRAWVDDPGNWGTYDGRRRLLLAMIDRVADEVSS